MRRFSDYERDCQHGYEDEQAEDNRVTASLAGMAVALFLVVVGLYLVQTLQRTGHVEDCLMAGRSNCDAMLAEAR